MIIKEIFYAVKCNRCGSVNESGDYTFMSDESSAIDEANDNDWAVENGEHFCPNCFTTNDETDEIIVKPAIPDLVKKIKKFLSFVTKNTPRTIEKSDSFEMSFNEYNPIGNAEVNWLQSFPNVSFERIPERHYNKIIITIKS